ncbi:MAG: hydroxypyruvate isomerase family protein [Marmoricola sp.]
MSHRLRYEVNCSILFTELPLLERPAAVRRAGFGAVEFWWPFAAPVPTDPEADAFVAAIKDAGVQLVGLNFFAGDMPAGDRGVLSDPGRSQAFRGNIDATIGIGEQLGCTAFNALYGNRVEGVDPARQDELAAENLALAAGAAARIGGTVLVEPVSGAPSYPLKAAADALTVVDRVGARNIGLLADLYHLAVNGDDVDKVIAEHTARIAHVQVADSPGRNEPGTGSLPLDEQLTALETNGYTGWVGLEYKPAAASADSFAWLEHARRAAGT